MTYAVVSPAMMVGKKTVHQRSKQFCKKSCKKLHHELNNKMELALIVCVSSRSIHHTSNKECAVVWEEIEQLSNRIHDMHIIVNNSEDDWESFIELECKT